MQTIGAIILAIFTLVWVVPMVRGIVKAIDTFLRRIVSAVAVILAAVPAILLAAPMIVQPEDVPSRFLPWTPVALDTEPDFISRWKVRALTVNAEMCRAALAETDSRLDFLSDAEDSENCHIRNRVRVGSLSRATMKPVSMRCEMAARLYMWERHALQDLARTHLGTRVARIEHYSAYSCRRMRTSRGTSSRWSQHATANAFDIAGFVMTDGRRVGLPKNWEGSSAEARFMRAVRDSLCNWFNVVLSPDYNALHADHFHVDMGPFLSCR
ncbi:MAG: extensin family protein [Paracoccaceae bacterium]